MLVILLKGKIMPRIKKANPMQNPNNPDYINYLYPPPSNTPDYIKQKIVQTHFALTRIVLEKLTMRSGIQTITIAGSQHHYNNQNHVNKPLLVVI